MAKGKSTAKKDGSVALKPGRDIEPAAVTGTDVTRLQLHRINEVTETLWLPGVLSEDRKTERIELAIAM